MIQLTSNMREVIGSIVGKLDGLQNPIFLERAVSAAVLPKIRYRVFIEGKNAEGQQIGTYSNSYLEFRKKK